MHEIKLPKLGQSVEEAAIVQWLKKEGDPVQEGEPIFTIQTDKAEIECESTASGVLLKIVVEPGIEVPVMTVVALVGEAGEALPDLTQLGATAAPASSPAPAAETIGEAAAAAPVAAAPATAGERPFVSPRARKLAEEKGIDAARLAGSGAQGRIMEADVLAAGNVKITPTAKRMAANAGVDIATLSGTGIGGKITKADVAGAGAPAASSPAAPVSRLPEGVQRVPLTPMRRIIADRMASSKFAAPHYYVTVEIDMMNAKKLRSKLPFKVSFNDLVLYAAVRALREFPNVNVQWAGDAILQMPDINLGVAVALPTGLIVPVIKKAQDLSLEGISSAAKALAAKAQNNKLLPDDYTGNTFTVSNLGAYGVDQFTAIINQPDSAILAVGQMKDRPAVIDGGIFVRPLMKITMSSDHRLIDGAIAAQFMGRMKEILEAADF